MYELDNMVDENAFKVMFFVVGIIFGIVCGVIFSLLVGI